MSAVAISAPALMAWTPLIMPAMVFFSLSASAALACMFCAATLAMSRSCVRTFRYICTCASVRRLSVGGVYLSLATSFIKSMVPRLSRSFWMLVSFMQPKRASESVTAGMTILRMIGAPFQ